MVLRITKEFKFEMAHALHKYPGKCANIHGHSYHMELTVTGIPIDNENDPENGMVVDFSVLKNMVNQEILSVFDHALVLKDSDPLADKISGLDYKVLKVTYQPTCENLVIDFVKRLKRSIPSNHMLHSIKLRETSSCFVTWYAKDNE